MARAPSFSSSEKRILNAPPCCIRVIDQIVEYFDDQGVGEHLRSGWNVVHESNIAQPNIIESLFCQFMDVLPNWIFYANVLVFLGELDHGGDPPGGKFRLQKMFIGSKFAMFCLQHTQVTIKCHQLALDVVTGYTESRLSLWLAFLSASSVPFCLVMSNIYPLKPTGCPFLTIEL